MTYRIELTPAARRDLAALSHEVLRRIDAHIRALAQNPHPPGAKKLQGSEGFFRIRVGDYRVIYMVERHQLIIVIVRIGHRRAVYRGH